MRLLWPAVLAAATCSCAATLPLQNTHLSDESKKACPAVCRELDMELGAVVVIHDSVGCVCQPAQRPGVAVTGGATAAGGSAIVLMEQAAAQQQRAQQTPPPSHH